jgi:serine/threonine protein kinase
MLRDIVEKPIPMKPYFSAEATSLLKALLERDPTKRIGYSDKDGDELRAHPFFNSIDWAEVRKQTHETAFRPKVKGAEDISCIDKLFTKEGLEETYVDPSELSGKQK